MLDSLDDHCISLLSVICHYHIKLSLPELQCHHHHIHIFANKLGINYKTIQQLYILTMFDSLNDHCIKKVLIYGISLK